MAHVSTGEIVQWLQENDRDTFDVLDKESMTVAVNRYHPGSTSTSIDRTHTEDELYYVISGSGKVRIEDDVYPVADGDVIFVKAESFHTFFDLEEEITVLKIFASG